MTVAPGESVGAALERAPPGGRVLLKPGEHREQIVLAGKELVGGGGD